MSHFCTPLIAIVISCLFFSSCGKSPQNKATEKVTQIFDDLSQSLGSIHDDASAKEGIRSIQIAVRGLQDLTQEVKGLRGKPSPRFKKKLDRTLSVVASEIDRLKNDEKLSPKMKERVLSALQYLGRTILDFENGVA